MMRRVERTTVLRYVMAVVAPMAGLALREIVGPALSVTSPFLFFTPSVMLAAWYGGLGPGIIATLVSTLLGDFFLMEPRHAFSTDSADIGRTLIFALVGLQISWLSAMLHWARHRAETHAQERIRISEALKQAHDLLEQRVAERTRELHLQKTLLESVSEASLDAILAVAEGGEIIFANRRFLETWGFQETPRRLDEIRSHLLKQLIEQQDPLAPEEAEAVRTHPAGADELLLQDGRSIERYSAAIADPHGARFGRVWFFRDITERKRLQRQIINVSERERQRIGQDLHDDLCQQLTGITCVGRLLQNQLASGTANAAEAAAAGRIVQMVQRANEQARSLAKGLQPVKLQEHGLASALQELCGTASAMFNVQCQFRGADQITAGVSPVAAVHLYRIGQEAVTNAVRHGHARHILIDFVVTEDRIILSVEDDGAGIPDPLPTGKQAGLGLQIMNYRARIIGGSLAIEPSQPRGTIVTCAVPLPRVSDPEQGGPAAAAGSSQEEHAHE